MTVPAHVARMVERKDDVSAGLEDATLERGLFGRLRDYIFAQRRLYFRNAARPVFEKKLPERLSALGIWSFEDYLHFLTHDPNGAEELGRLLDSLAESEEEFFRGGAQMDVLRFRILPSLVSRKHAEGNRSLVLWSLSADRGQEAYTLGIVVREALGKEISRWDARVCAMCSSEEKLQHARQARYKDISLRNTPGEVRTRHFKREKTFFIVKNEVRDIVEFTLSEFEHPGASGLPPEADVVFARHFLSRFEADRRKTLLHALHANMRPGGLLFVAHNETLSGSGGLFTAAYYPRAVAYRKA